MTATRDKSTAVITDRDKATRQEGMGKMARGALLILHDVCHSMKGSRAGLAVSEIRKWEGVSDLQNYWKSEQSTWTVTPEVFVIVSLSKTKYVDQGLRMHWEDSGFIGFWGLMCVVSVRRDFLKNI